jgi:hypothetical protein
MAEVIKYDNLRECFLLFLNKPDMTDEECRTHYWVGHNGTRPYRIRIDKWLASNPKVWGWCEHKARTIHIYVSPEADIFDVITMMAHELGHMQRPRYPIDSDEEKKAANYEKVTKTAIDIAKEMMGL